MTHKEIEEFIYQLPHARLEYPFGEGVAVYKNDRDRMFVLIAEGSDPLRISLKCDPQLAVILREKYESVQEGYHLNKKHWNTMLLTGQVPDDEIRDLIRHSYELAK